MLPVIKPDDIGRSQTSQGAPLQRGIFGSVYDSIVGALEPMATIVEEGPAESTRAERVPAQPAAPPPAPRKTMAELWDFIAGNFMCERVGSRRPIRGRREAKAAFEASLRGVP